MDRLTPRNRDDIGNWDPLDEVSLLEQLYRLADYEDTGLTPEDLRNIGSLETIPIARERLLDILHAEEEGRLVVLPCKVGDTVYRVFSVKDREPVVVPCEIKTVGQAADLVGRIGKKGWMVSTYLTREEAEAALKKEADNVDHE